MYETSILHFQLVFLAKLQSSQKASQEKVHYIVKTANKLNSLAKRIYLGTLKLRFWLEYGEY